MSCLNPHNLRSAFKLGYVFALVSDQLNANPYSLNQNKPEETNVFLTMIKFFDKEYKTVFDEDFVFPSKFKSDKDVSEYLSALYELSKCKLEQSDNRQLELAYLSGGIIALSYHTCFSIYNKDMFKKVFTQLIKLIGEENSVRFAEEIIDNFDTLCTNKKIEKRNQLCKIFINNFTSTEQSVSLEYLDYCIVSNY